MTGDDLPTAWSDQTVEYPLFRDFEKALRDDTRIRRLLKDNEFAQQLCDLWAAYDFFEIRSGEAIPGGTDDFQAMIAHYRNRGESHLIFIGGNVTYPMRRTINAEVRAELLRLGYKVAASPR